MRIRIGFVSNSSSSSFAVIEECGKIDKEAIANIRESAKNGVYYVGLQGESEFGWQKQIYTDIHSKINWAWIQAIYNMERVVQEGSINALLKRLGMLHREIGQQEFMFQQPFHLLIKSIICKTVFGIRRVLPLVKENTIKVGSLKGKKILVFGQGNPSYWGHIDHQSLVYNPSYWGHIDHQSLVYPATIFHTRTHLFDFLFREGSHIVNDNDNS